LQEQDIILAINGVKEDDNAMAGGTHSAPAMARAGLTGLLKGTAFRSFPPVYVFCMCIDFVHGREDDLPFGGVKGPKTLLFAFVFTTLLRVRCFDQAIVVVTG